MKPVFRKIENNVALIDIDAETNEKRLAYKELRAEGYTVFTVPKYEYSLATNLNSLAAQTVCLIDSVGKYNTDRDKKELFTWYCLYLPLAKYLNDIDEPRITKEYNETRK